MKKEKPEPKPKLAAVILLGSIAITLLISSSVGYFLILPTFIKNSNISQEIKTEKAKAAKIDQSLLVLRSHDKGKIADLSLFLNTFIPAEIDMLHFATLNEIVAKDAGAQITTIQLSQAKLKLSEKPAPTSSGTSTTAKPAKTTQIATPTITVTYKSNFESLLKLLDYWFLADQVVGVNDIIITGQSGGVVSYTITYEFPKATVVTKATVDDALNLTSKQIDNLQALHQKIKYVATPSANPLGNKNPFGK